MEKEIAALALTAASLGFVHTILGPDHYLPFIMMSWARKWSALKTAIITFLCGLGHIASSVVLGIIGIVLGLAVAKIEGWESSRGDIAAWLLIAFGLAYCVWGIRQAYRRKEHTHSHLHPESDKAPRSCLRQEDAGAEHSHEHTHSHNGHHSHVHLEPYKTSITPWVLFVIFVFGPCEPLIPILMYPAARNSVPGLILVTTTFGTATIGTMLVVVMLARAGVNLLPLGKLNRYSHALSGAAILLCGLAIVFVGL